MLSLTHVVQLVLLLVEHVSVSVLTKTHTHKCSLKTACMLLLHVDTALHLQVFALATVCERLPSGGSVAWQAPTLTYLVHKALGDTWNKVCNTL
jgi:hypothetical protein